MLIDFGCVELEFWNLRRGLGLEMKVGKMLDRSVFLN